jgi:hypothetical protein
MAASASRRTSAVQPSGSRRTNPYVVGTTLFVDGAQSDLSFPSSPRIAPGMPDFARRNRAVQPPLAVPERAPNEKLAIWEMDERRILPRFEKSNILDPHDPRFDIVSQ